MSMFVGYQTAAELLLYRGTNTMPKPSRSTSFAQASARAADAKALCRCLVLPSSAAGKKAGVHLLAPESSRRRRTDYLTTHLWSGKLPAGSFFKMDSGLYCSTPEFTVVQMAKVLTLVGEVELITNFCADYALDHASGEICKAKPLTSLKKIAAFIGRMPAAPGTRRASHALSFALEGSASPPETKLAIYNTLSPRYGGFGFSKPLLNYEIKLGKRARRQTMHNAYRLDEFFKDERIGIEYQSRQYHLGDHRQRADEQRRKVLESLGIRVIFVQPEDLYASPSAYDDIARQIARHMGKRLHVLDSAHAKAHRQLHRELFGQKPRS